MNLEEQIVEAIEHDRGGEIRQLLAETDELMSRGIMAGLVREAAGRGASSVLTALVDAGAPVDDADDRGYRPLHYAAIAPQGDSAAMMRVLLEAGANPNAVTNDHKLTPMDLAVKFRKEEAVRDLLAAGGVFTQAAHTDAVRWLRRVQDSCPGDFGPGNGRG